MKLTLFPYLLSVIGLIGCSSGIKISMPESLQFHHEQEKGFLVAALGATTKWPETGQYLTTTLLVRRIGETESIKVINNNATWHFQERNVIGQLISLPLPVGRYEIHQVQFIGSNGNHIIRTETPNNLALQFDIKAQTASYIGEFIASSHTVNSQQWHTPYPDGSGYLQHGYKESRDSNLFYQNHPKLQKVQFQRHPLNSVWNGLIYTNIREDDLPPLRVNTKSKS
jgi:hypothetical protein